MRYRPQVQFLCSIVGFRTWLIASSSWHCTRAHGSKLRKFDSFYCVRSLTGKEFWGHTVGALGAHLVRFSKARLWELLILCLMRRCSFLGHVGDRSCFQSLERSFRLQTFALRAARKACRICGGIGCNWCDEYACALPLTKGVKTMNKDILRKIWTQQITQQIGREWRAI